MLLLVAGIARMLDREVIPAIAADWANEPRWLGDADAIRAGMIDCAAGVPAVGIEGFIRPRFTPERPRMFGAWSF
jgi:hypothetical protein